MSAVFFNVYQRVKLSTNEEKRSVSPTVGSSLCSSVGAVSRLNRMMRNFFLSPLRRFLHSIPVYRGERLGRRLICSQSGKSIPRPLAMDSTHFASYGSSSRPAAGANSGRGSMRRSRASPRTSGNPKRSKRNPKN